MSKVVSLEWGNIAALIDSMVEQGMPFILLNSYKLERSRQLYKDIKPITSQLILRMRDKDVAFLKLMKHHGCRIRYDYDVEAAWTSDSLRALDEKVARDVSRSTDKVG